MELVEGALAGKDAAVHALAGKWYINTRDEDGWTSLLLALRAGHESTARRTDFRGANVKDITGHGKETALILSAAARTPSMVKQTIREGPLRKALPRHCRSGESTPLLVWG